MRRRCCALLAYHGTQCCQVQWKRCPCRQAPQDDRPSSLQHEDVDVRWRRDDPHHVSVDHAHVLLEFLFVAHVEPAEKTRSSGQDADSNLSVVEISDAETFNSTTKLEDQTFVGQCPVEPATWFSCPKSVQI
ncbi:hypothetical protein GQ600_1595 [Phytophthora cactorum]|nr:hypothetical protein GQ600_1595 [Phytophthora cactorum]